MLAAPPNPTVLRLAVRATRIQREMAERADAKWRTWLPALFANHFGVFAPHHEEFWDWVWAMEPKERPRPFVGIWARKHGKSTSAETAAAALGLRGRRKYAVYVRSTQDQADNSVSNIASLLESRAVAARYPGVGERAVGKYGNSKGWRRNRLRACGFTVDAMGLDTAVRGAKVEDERPDLIILDDIDEKHDSPATTQKKIETITTSVLPIGTDHTAVIAIQNLIIPDGVFGQLSDDRADWLIDRIVSGPHPAIEGMEVEQEYDESLGKVRSTIKAGTPTWDGFDLDACQREINTIGLSAFMEECQHQVDQVEGALWTKSIIQQYRKTGHPDLKRVVVGVDPSGGGDEIGIVVAGIGTDNRGYVLADYTAKGSLGPGYWAGEVIRAMDEHQGDRIAAERNFGGDMVEYTIKVSDPNASVKVLTASRGKQQRAEPVANLYTEGRVSHVGVFPELEREMVRWKHGEKWSPNRLDALVWSLTELILENKRSRIAVLGGPVIR